MVFIDCLFVNSDTGFDNAFVFKNITEENITQIETYIRDESLCVRASNLSDSFDHCDPEHKCDALLDETELIEIFGEKYAAAPSRFKFQPGEKMLIRELVKHVKEIVDRDGENKGLHHFQERKRRAKKINVQQKRKKNFDENSVPFQFENKSNKLSMSDTEMELHHSELKAKLFSMCLQCFQAFDLDEQLIVQFDEHMIDLQSKNGALYGIITCILCKNDDSNKTKKNMSGHSVRYYESPGSNYWILSNFKKHLKKTHHLMSSQADLRKRKRVPLKTLNEAVEFEGLKDGESVEYIDVEIVDPVENADQLNGSSHEVDSAEIATNDDWLFPQLSQQISDMVGVVLTNGDCTVEVQFLIGNEIETVTAATIIGDGNCLPGAICHQLYHDPIGSKEHRKRIKELRASVVDYILQPANFESFEYTLKNRVYDIKTKDEIDDMTMECKLFVRHCLSKDGYWAGHEFLVAATNILRVNILVFYENGDFHLANNGTEIYTKTIALAFRLNFDSTGYNHYDSVCDIDSNLLCKIAEKKFKK